MSTVNILVVNNEDQENTNSNNNILKINSYDFDYRESETSLSACAYFICSFLVEDLDYIVKLPLVAAQTQDLFSNYTGLHDLILQDAISGGIAENSMQLCLLGSSVFSISDALVFSQSKNIDTKLPFVYSTFIRVKYGTYIMVGSILFSQRSI